MGNGSVGGVGGIFAITGTNNNFLLLCVPGNDDFLNQSVSAPHYSTCSPRLDTCPDGKCDELEQMRADLCPQDCASKSFRFKYKYTHFSGNACKYFFCRKEKFLKKYKNVFFRWNVFGYSVTQKYFMHDFNNKK